MQCFLHYITFFLFLFLSGYTILKMGTSHSTDKDDKKYSLVDYGTWIPLGLYEENDECNLKLVRELISSKRLAPFYKGKFYFL